MIATDLTQESTRRIVKTADGNVEINEAGTGHPLFLLHGTGPGATGWTNFAPNLRVLAEKYRVIALTFPGWGLSDPVDPAMPQRTGNARAVKLVMDELDIDRAAIVGNSMGGAATQQFAVDYPERMSHFVTMGANLAGPNLFVPAGLTEGIRIIRETYADPTPENFRRLVSIMVYDSAFVTDELCELRSKAALANPQHLENWLKRNTGPQPVLDDLTPGLAQLAAPALIVHGRDDRVVPMEGSMRLNTVMQNSRMLIFNRCGHWAQIEHANEFNRILDTFLSLKPHG